MECMLIQGCKIGWLSVEITIYFMICARYINSILQTMASTWCSDVCICQQTLSLPRSKQFSVSIAQGKL